MNATSSRQLAQLVQEPPTDLDPMTQIQIREQPRQWPRHRAFFEQSSPQEDEITQ